MDLIKRISECEWLSADRRVSVEAGLRMAKDDPDTQWEEIEDVYLSDQLAGTFLWDVTVEGYDYWEGLFDELYEHEDHPEDESDE